MPRWFRPLACQTVPPYAISGPCQTSGCPIDLVKLMYREKLERGAPQGAMPNDSCPYGTLGMKEADKCPRDRMSGDLCGPSSVLILLA